MDVGTREDPDHEHLWAVVLAGGSGTRVRSFFTDAEGRPVPKQFCNLDGHDPLVRQAVDRAARLVPANRIVVALTEQHREWWEQVLPDFRGQNLVVQPHNRGTAAGLLLPLVEILRRDPRATVLVFPSDHFVADEQQLARAVARALDSVQEDPDRLVLLGMPPHESDTEYGWILPSGPSASVQRVARFVEKPDQAKATALRRRNALLNSLILAGTGKTMLDLYGVAVPELVERFTPFQERKPWKHSAFEESYRSLPSLDFSRQILERCSKHLSVVRVSDCGWTDLGTPERLRHFRECQRHRAIA